MIEKFRSDALFSYLLEKCSLTATQIDTVLAKGQNEKSKKRTLFRMKHHVSSGAFLRSLRQAQSNIEASIYTLLLLEYLHLVDTAKLTQLVRISGLIQEVGELASEPRDIGQLIAVMGEFVGLFSGRRKVIS